MQRKCVVDEIQTASRSSEDAFQDSVDPFSAELRSIGGAALDRLLAVGHPLLTGASAGARLFACFVEAKRLLDTVTLPELLACVIADRTQRRALADLSSHLEHVGLLLPPDAEGELEWAAIRAGFPNGHAKVASVVVAKELSELAGDSSSGVVRTTLFKAYGKGPLERAVCIEGFVPHGVAPETVDRWIAEGAVVHVGVKVKSLAALEPARLILETEGFAMPPFMNGKPMTNPVEESTVLYFDRLQNDRRFRIEFSWSPEPIW